jgi:hypothetical protein
MAKKVYQAKGFPGVTRTTDRTYTHVILGRFSGEVLRRYVQQNEAKIRKEAKVLFNSITRDMKYREELFPGCKTADEAAAHAYQKRVDSAAVAQEGTEWSALTWCGRYDLALKAVGQFWSSETKIVEVECIKGC